MVFAAAVPPVLLQSDDNPDGPLTEDAAGEQRSGLEGDRDAFFDDFITQFFTAGEGPEGVEEQRQEALTLCKQSDQQAALGCMDAFGTTDFREDLDKIDVPTLVIHGDGDGIVPFDGSGRRTDDAIEGSELVVLEGAPHGCNVSHSDDSHCAAGVPGEAKRRPRKLSHGRVRSWVSAGGVPAPREGGPVLDLLAGTQRPRPLPVGVHLRAVHLRPGSRPG